MVGRQIKTSQQEKPLSSFPFTEHRKKAIVIFSSLPFSFRMVPSGARVVGVYDHTSSRGIRRRLFATLLAEAQNFLVC